MNKTESIISSIELKINKILIRFNELENENLDLKREINLLIDSICSPCIFNSHFDPILRQMITL